MPDIKDIQSRVKQLAGMRDSLIREAGAEERKLEEAYEKLRELGVKNPENYSTEQLQQLATKLQTELDQKLLALEEQVKQGEQLAAKYQEAVGGN